VSVLSSSEPVGTHPCPLALKETMTACSTCPRSFPEITLGNPNGADEELCLPKQTYKVYKMSPVTQMCRYQHEESRKNQVNMKHRRKLIKLQ